MFEFFIAFKYLIPKKRALSTSLIALMSVFVISLVVWLVLIFLSVTTGIEKNWIQKLISLNAPLRITPTEQYFSSYYYQSDSISSSSHYAYRSIGEKVLAEKTDPHTSVDQEIPAYWPKPENLDPVKQAFSILEKERKSFSELSFQDYEISGALLKLSLTRTSQEKESFLSQMSYLSSINDQSPLLPSLLLPPTPNDLNAILLQWTDLYKKSPLFQEKIQKVFSAISVTQIATEPLTKISEDVFPKNKKFLARPIFEENNLQKLLIPSDLTDKKSSEYGELFWNKKNWIFHLGKKEWVLSPNILICLEKSLIWDVTEKPLLSDTEILFSAKTSLQGILVQKTLPFGLAKLHQCTLLSLKQPIPDLPWTSSFFEGKRQKILLGKNGDTHFPILLPKTFQESGVLIGNVGSLCYTTQSAFSMQEQQIPIYVSGFYDPGLLPIGGRFLWVPSSVTQTINAASSVFLPDGMPTNGIYVWLNDLSLVDPLKKKLSEAFLKANISPFWNISTFREYEFSKDLLEQFQSDRTLFTLIALIILLVACSNIISLLILLVNDKKKEIAVLASMGASRKSIALIFGTCGVFMGILSSLLGTLAAIFTLHHLGSVVRFLSFLQGHEAFHPAFFGNSLPNTLSFEALLFILIATPILSLLAGLIPAIKASSLCPSSILRAQ